jgi:YVTN family beta-propeller protein
MLCDNRAAFRAYVKKKRITMLRFFTFVLTVGFTLSSFSAAPPAPSGMLLVANKGDETLGLIDLNSYRQIATIHETGVTGHEVAASPDGKTAFVPIYGDSGVGLPGTDGSTIDVIDIAQRKRIRTIDFGHGVRPHCAMFNPKDGMLYVTTELDKAVAIIDPNSMKIVARIPTGEPESHMLAISPDGSRGYTANVGPGTVSVLDLAARKTLSIIPVAKHVQRIAASPDGRWAFTSDTENPRMAVIDTTADKVDRWIALPAAGYGAAATPDGKWLLVAIPEANAIAVIDLATMKVSKTVAVPHGPQEVLVRPDGEFAYISCSRPHQVAAVQLHDWNVRVIEAGLGADGLAWAK